ncbi:MAG: nucleotidyltransferase family protein [Nanoarchaeota archaeon]|nr:nucleotidyltransferase family protein [Nanoarchaeota archaeon]MBU1004596.1 nucleotidyltransferase family protein [Nanoarchaeota archaeon]MBU1946978.1 nucleotidyltransferase family protein [Nanoarchaeota archaeon]
MNRKKLLKTIVADLKKQGAKKITLFGSYSRGEENKGSDVDIIVEFFKPKSLLKFVEIEQELSEKTGKKIDLLTENSISPYLIDRIRKERVELY